MAVITKGAGVSRANINLVSGEVTALSFAKSYEYYAVRNDGANDFYISTEDSACTPNGDNVVCVKASDSYVHHNGLGKEGIVYFSGNGAVTVIGQDTAENPFKTSWKGGVDSSLSKAGYAADAKATGDNIVAINSNISSLGARVDNIATLPEGSTTGDAELIDMRLGADGNTYPNAGTAVRTQIGELKEDLTNLGDAIGTYENDIELSFISGKIISHSGVISDNQYHGISNEINVIPYEKYKIKIKTTSNPSFCAFYDENDNVVEALYDESLGNSSWVYLSTEVTVPKNASKMILCGNPEVQTEAYVKKISYYDIQNELSEINDKIDYSIEELMFDTEEGIVSCKSGNLSNNTGFIRTKDFIKVNSLDEFYYSGTIYNYGGIYGYDSDYNPVISILDDIENESAIVCNKMLLNIPENVSYIKACSLKNTSYTFAIHKKIANIKNQISDIRKNNNNLFELYVNKIFSEIQSKFENKGMSTVALFEKIAVIGDSYSSGAVYGDDVGTQGRHNAMSWGKILARRNGIDCTLYVQPGITTKGWLVGMDDGVHNAILPTMLSDEAKNLYFIMLGINDTIDGSISDCNEDWAQNNDTWFGNYGKVIGNIKSHAPNAKIICIKPPFGGKSNTSFDMINSVAEFYGVPCISSYDDDYFSSEFYTSNMSTSHPVGATYAGMALAFERLISKCIVENIAYFKDYNGND